MGLAERRVVDVVEGMVDLPDQLAKQRVAGGIMDGGVKAVVGWAPILSRLVDRVQFGHTRQDDLAFLLGRVSRCQTGGFDFKRAADGVGPDQAFGLKLQGQRQVDRAGGDFGGQCRTCALVPGHDPHALPGFQNLADRGAGNAKPFGKFDLGWQAVTDAKTFAFDQGDERIDDTAVAPAPGPREHGLLRPSDGSAIGHGGSPDCLLESVVAHCQT